MGKRPTAQQSARMRAELIMKVRCGIMTAQEAATRLGVSRKTYYKWEQRGLSALLDGVADQPPGRPQNPVDGCRQELERQLAVALRENELLTHKMALKDVLMDLKLKPGTDRAKKNERIGRVLSMIGELKATFSISYAGIARQMGLSYATLMRWCARCAVTPTGVGRPRASG